LRNWEGLLSFQPLTKACKRNVNQSKGGL